MTQPARFTDTYSATRLHAAQEPATVVLTVTLAGCNGERWQTLGIGATREEALTWALESAPTGIAWLVASWSDTYGD